MRLVFKIKLKYKSPLTTCEDWEVGEVRELVLEDDGVLEICDMVWEGVCEGDCEAKRGERGDFWGEK